MLFKSHSQYFKNRILSHFGFKTNNMLLQLNRCEWTKEHTMIDYKIRQEWLVLTFISGLVICMMCFCCCKCSFKKQLKKKAVKNLEIIRKSIDNAQKGDLENQLSTITDAYKQLDRKQLDRV